MQVFVNRGLLQFVFVNLQDVESQFASSYFEQALTICICACIGFSVRDTKVFHKIGTCGISNRIKKVLVFIITFVYISIKKSGKLKCKNGLIVDLNCSNDAQYVRS